GYVGKAERADVVNAAAEIEAAAAGAVAGDGAKGQRERVQVVDAAAVTAAVARASAGARAADGAARAEGAEGCSGRAFAVQAGAIALPAHSGCAADATLSADGDVVHQAARAQVEGSATG